MKGLQRRLLKSEGPALSYTEGMFSAYQVLFAPSVACFLLSLLPHFFFIVVFFIHPEPVLSAECELAYAGMWEKWALTSSSLKSGPS